MFCTPWMPVHDWPSSLAPEMAPGTTGSHRTPAIIRLTAILRRRAMVEPWPGHWLMVAPIMVPAGSHSGNLENSGSHAHFEISGTTPVGTVDRLWSKVAHVRKATKIESPYNMAQPLAQAGLANWIKQDLCNYHGNAYFTMSGHGPTMVQPLAHASHAGGRGWLKSKKP